MIVATKSLRHKEKIMKFDLAPDFLTARRDFEVVVPCWQALSTVSGEPFGAVKP